MKESPAEKKLRVLFMGSPALAVPSLRGVHQRHQVVCVVTQPDRPFGRGRRLKAPPVKVVAEELGLEVLQPEKLRRRAVREQLSEYGADIFVVVAYGRILSARLLSVPRLGCINVHASLLPRYRGAGPIQWAILRGESETGVTIMQMDAGMDTGPMLLQRKLAIRREDTAETLQDRLAPLGAEVLLQALEQLAAGEKIQATAQNDAEATLAPLLKKEDGLVQFGWQAKKVDCWIRGMDPWPGAYTRVRYRDGAEPEMLKLYHSRLAQERGKPGEVLALDDRGLLVACADQAVWISQLQRPAKARLKAAAFAAGRPLKPGTLLGV